MARASGSYPAGRWFKSDIRYHSRLVGQAVKTRPFHGCNSGSIPLRVTNEKTGTPKLGACFFVGASQPNIGLRKRGFLRFEPCSAVSCGNLAGRSRFRYESRHPEVGCLFFRCGLYAERTHRFAVQFAFAPRANIASRRDIFASQKRYCALWPQRYSLHPQRAIFLLRKSGKLPLLCYPLTSSPYSGIITT